MKKVKCFDAMVATELALAVAYTPKPWWWWIYGL
jgi:hypothetical protein